MRIYLASSWRNPHFEEVHATLSTIHLRGQPVEVYNFRDPESHFTWDQVDKNWATWGVEEFNKHLHHPEMERGYQRDRRALQDCDVLVLLLPCGNDAHLEAGVAIGWGKPVVIYAPNGDGFTPGLMYKLAEGSLVEGTSDLLERIRILGRIL